MRDQQERYAAGLCHLFNLIPVWGIAFAGAIWFKLVEESRKVVFHARQAIAFQAVFMLALFAWILMRFVIKVVAEIFPNVSRLFDTINNTIIIGVYIVYAAFCLYGFVKTIAGGRFRYPLVGESANPEQSKPQEAGGTAAEPAHPTETDSQP